MAKGSVNNKKMMKKRKSIYSHVGNGESGHITTGNSEEKA
jgi:hypothetical protein